MTQVAHDALAKPKRPACGFNQAQQLPAGQIGRQVGRQVGVREVLHPTCTSDIPYALASVAVDPEVTIAV